MDAGLTFGSVRSIVAEGDSMGAAATTEKSFLQAVCETPEDDAPRLVFADWLDDNGQGERAEFIRLQCRLAGMSGLEDGHAGLVRREKELLDAHGQKWSKPLTKFTIRVTFRRGFVEGMTMTAKKFLATADALFAATPLQTLSPLQARQSWTDSRRTSPACARSTSTPSRSASAAPSRWPAASTLPACGCCTSAPTAPGAAPQRCCARRTSARWPACI
jgi:uncharacterized protein (TIGR02996 family)